MVRDGEGRARQSRAMQSRARQRNGVVWRGIGALSKGIVWQSKAPQRESKEASCIEKARQENAPVLLEQERGAEVPKTIKISSIFILT